MDINGTVEADVIFQDPHKNDTIQTRQSETKFNKLIKPVTHMNHNRISMV